ncbi:pyrroline-5-carboxylate reductase [Pseudalkalibacillus sp. R45]|uniref:pyrroline-5-carboxylate reductase n=1 Tax=Pseudalkalibacillus sp. R45 TaxID=3457433 RepID=UPI003FCD5D82
MRTINRITFVGAGSMAESIIKGLVSRKMIPSPNIMVTNRTDEDRLEYLEDKYGIHISHDDERILTETDLIVLAMKPKDAQSGLERIRPYVKHSHIITSVMAGITTEFIESVLECDCPVIRTMPNTSAEIGHSTTTLCIGKNTTLEQSLIVEELFKAIGSVTVVQEQYMDATTALAGSGPAYLYYIAEAMKQAAINLELDEAKARELIAETMIGAGQMMKASSTDLNQLRINITSPGGTTEAGLSALMERHVEDAFKHCILDAAKRSKELQQHFSTCKKNTAKR